ncbi:MAG: preprotein translocase subunit SecG [Deltaproteobacteria bacterium]|nr:preprotein translocase subunit SecG [Deltaproteobacteria bacterium]
MGALVLTLHFVVCIFLIIVILLQAGKGADMGAAFGGGSQTVFGPRGAATFLSKLTAIAAGIFLLTSFFLANYAKNQTSSSVVKGMTLPATPQKPESAPTETQSESKPESKPTLSTESTPSTTESKPATSNRNSRGRSR